MTYQMPFWLPAVVADLREVSGDLLEAGLASTALIGALGGHGPRLRGLLHLADTFVVLGPRLLSEIDYHADGSSGEWQSVRVAQGARPPTAPYDYAIHGGVALPQRWLRFDADQRPSEHALRWILHLGRHLREQLQTHGLRLERQLEEALLVRSGESAWAMQDAQTLRGLSSDVQQRLVAMRQMEADVRSTSSGLRIYGSDRPPTPYPQQPAWARLKRLARELLNPEAMLGMILSDLLSEPIAMADVPFLYQRWCGLHLIRAFERLGWQRRGDLVGTLFLGGRIEFLGLGAGPVTLWIEPRISRATMAMTGWGCSARGDELTPDFLITCGQVGSRDAFVLDATLSTSDAVLSSKAKYRLGIVGLDTLLIAGVPVARHPLRAWAIAPLNSTQCRLNDPEGRTGGVPLHPGRTDLQALNSWVEDISLHAQRQVIGLAEMKAVPAGVID